VETLRSFFTSTDLLRSGPHDLTKLIRHFTSFTASSDTLEMNIFTGAWADSLSSRSADLADLTCRFEPGSIEACEEQPRYDVHNNQRP
jgi:hypothetical protein